MSKLDTENFAVHKNFGVDISPRLIGRRLRCVNDIEQMIEICIAMYSHMCVMIDFRSFHSG